MIPRTQKSLDDAVVVLQDLVVGLSPLDGGRWWLGRAGGHVMQRDLAAKAPQQAIVPYRRDAEADQQDALAAEESITSTQEYKDAAAQLETVQQAAQ